jgi:hypothetical protein
MLTVSMCELVASTVTTESDAMQCRTIARLQQLLTRSMS